MRKYNYETFDVEALRDACNRALDVAHDYESTADEIGASFRNLLKVMLSSFFYVECRENLHWEDSLYTLVFGQENAYAEARSVCGRVWSVTLDTNGETIPDEIVHNENW